MHHHCTNRSYLAFCNWLNWRLAKIKALFNNEIDCTTRENALKALGLSAEEAEDRSILDERYEDLCEALKKRMVKAKELKSKFLAKEFEKRFDRVQIGYYTLTR